MALRMTNENNPFSVYLISTFSFAQDKTPVKRDPYLQASFSGKAATAKT
jgi:hypothetical protein